jgi:hypothetical protein
VGVGVGPAVAVGVDVGGGVGNAWHADRARMANNQTIFVVFFM